MLRRPLCSGTADGRQWRESCAVPGCIPRGLRAVLLIPVLGAAAICVSSASATAHSQSSLAAAPRGRPVALSDETTFTRWAHPRTKSTVRAQPLDSARPLGHLHLFTEEGEPEVYLLQQELTTAAGVSWVKLRIPARPNGTSGWVPLRALGPMHLTDLALRVNLRLLRATLYRDARPVWSAPVGVGAPRTPTPTGHFWVRELLHVASDTLYGPFAFGTSDYSVLSEWPDGGVVGIHGTNQPELVPGRPSHGCIRMRNADIIYLAHHMPVGALVNIFD
jgi:lipoprotein-anchoring transpeptidase ErfK/SrfK